MPAGLSWWHWVTRREVSLQDTKSLPCMFFFALSHPNSKLHSSYMTYLLQMTAHTGAAPVDRATRSLCLATRQNTHLVTEFMSVVSTAVPRLVQLGVV